MGPRTWFPRLCQRKTDDPTTVTELGDPCGSASMGGRHEIESTSPRSDYHNWITAGLPVTTRGSCPHGDPRKLTLDIYPGGV